MASFLIFIPDWERIYVSMSWEMESRNVNNVFLVVNALKHAKGMPSEKFQQHVVINVMSGHTFAEE